MMRAINSSVWVVGKPMGAGFWVRMVCWSQEKAKAERLDVEEIRSAMIYVDAPVVGTRRRKLSLRMVA